MASALFFNHTEYSEKLKARLADFCFEANTILPFQEGLTSIACWGAQYFLKLLQDNQLFTKVNNHYHINDIKKQLQLLSCYDRQLNSLLEILIRLQLIASPCPDIYQLKQRQIINLEQLLAEEKRLLTYYPELKTNIVLLRNILQYYLEILSGKENFINVFFADGSFNIVADLYKNNPISRYYSHLSAATISFFIEYFSEQDLPTINILEIGAGIGSTSEQLLLLLNKINVNKQYYYTDVSNAFLAYGQQRFKQYNDFLNFYRFDINQSPVTQRLPQNYFNIILADNVLHNAASITTTLTYLNSLLKPGGMLVLNEGIAKNDYATLIYGLTSGWWSFTDAQWRIPETPLINTRQWQKLLTAVPFDFLALNQVLNIDAIMNQDIIVGFKAY